MHGGRNFIVLTKELHLFCIKPMKSNLYIFWCHLQGNVWMCVLFSNSYSLLEMEISWWLFHHTCVGTKTYQTDSLQQQQYSDDKAVTMTTLLCWWLGLLWGCGYQLWCLCELGTISLTFLLGSNLVLTGCKDYHFGYDYRGAFQKRVWALKSKSS